MRFRCPSCDTWQSVPGRLDPDSLEVSCRECGSLLQLRELDPSVDDGAWEASVVEAPPVALATDEPLEAFLARRPGEGAAARAERLSGGRAQVLALTLAWSPALWIPCALVVGVGLAVAMGCIMAGQRVDRSLALLAVVPAVGVVAWSQVLAAAAVAHLLEVRRAGRPVGMGRSLRMILEHGNGATGSATRFVILGCAGAVLLGLVALLGAFPGLAGGEGLAITGGLLWLQVLAAAGGIGLLVATGIALLLHPGLAASRRRSPGEIFWFVWRLIKRRRAEVVSRVALPLLAVIGLGVAGSWLLRAALSIVVSINARVIGAPWADLLAASPVRALFGAPELLDPGATLGFGGILVAASLVLTLAVLLGFVASFMGVSGLLLCHGLELQRRLQEGDHG